MKPGREPWESVPPKASSEESTSPKTRSAGVMFRHQLYKDEPRTLAPRHLSPRQPPLVESNEWTSSLNEAAARLSAGGVRLVYLLHGTFAGTDSLGLLRELGRFFPALRDGLARIAKRLVDAAMSDNGNFTALYARRFEQAFRAIGDERTRVVGAAWSGENHHLGRADAAVRMIEHLASLRLVEEPYLADGPRVMIWGHSHAGNVMAMLSQLLSCDGDLLRAFFDAARCHYQLPIFGRIEIAYWQAVEELLRGHRRSVVRYPLDFVTFGTPIRYGWNERGFARLLHFVNHRPADGLPPHLTTPPTSVDDVLTARHGDYIQQFGIAGTNTPPFPLLRAWWADRRLNRLLQPADLTSWNLPERLKSGVRVPDAGRTLLVDYGPQRDGIEEHLAGHAVYTRLTWLPFHAAETARTLYSDAPGAAPA